MSTDSADGGSECSVNSLCTAACTALFLGLTRITFRSSASTRTLFPTHPYPQEMASSLALVPCNRPNADKIVATIEKNSRPDGGRWALVLKAILSPSPGRTLDQLYTSLGGVLEKQANKVAYTLGLGPHIAAQRIKLYFGNGDDRLQRLHALRITTVPSKLEKRCSKFVRYTHPYVLFDYNKAHS